MLHCERSLESVIELNYSEIGRVLNMPRSTVNPRFHRAKPFLRAALTTQLHITSVQL